MFTPNTSCVIEKNSGNDVYGQPVPGVLIEEKCSIVSLMIESLKSSTRKDSSASDGAAMEFQAKTIILLTPKTKADIDDVIAFGGNKFKLITKMPRIDVTGKLDHYQVGLIVWSGK